MWARAKLTPKAASMAAARSCTYTRRRATSCSGGREKSRTTRYWRNASMIQNMKDAALLVGLGIMACVTGAASQPELQPSNPPGVYVYSSDGRSYLGVDIRDVTADRVATLKLKEERGVEVTMVDQDAPAGKA